MNKKSLILLLPFILLVKGASNEFNFKGQASFFSSFASSKDYESYSSRLLYIPEVTYNFQKGPLRYGFDFGIQSKVTNTGDEKILTEHDLYRSIFRVDRYNDQFRLGLQKINFGPGQVLRLLQWFDEQDIKDPLALSPGVWSIMYRRFLKSGIDLRIWNVIGQENPTRKLYLNTNDNESMDYGGRIEIPAGRGTIGGTIHMVDPIKFSQFSETRYALDGRWDILIGIWFESVFSKTNIQGFDEIRTNALMAGADYTFGIGNGLYTSFEFATWMSDAGGSNKNIANAFAMTSNYPIGLNDAVSFYLTAINQEEDQIHIAPFFGWRHTLGNWMIFVSAFNYPANLIAGSNLPSGKGMQIYIAFNH